jgi:hypothetical protein
MIKPIPRFWRFGAVPILSFIVLGCQSDPEPRKYREIVTRGENSTLQGNPSASMTWALPNGWTIQPEGDAMRLTGFWAPDPARFAAGETDPRPVDVSIVQLAGPAGGLEANVTRWLGQIKVQANFAQRAITEATPVRIGSGQEGIIVDFTNFLSGDMTQTESIIGAIVTVGETTVFVKAMGSRERLKRIKPQLIEFCENLSVGSGAAYGAGETTP